MKAIRIYYYNVKAKVEYGIVWPIRTSIYFMFLAWMVLRKKIIIIDSDALESRGGYKYMSLVISKRPLSKSHEYTDLGVNKK